MKNLLLLFSLFLFIVSCSKESSEHNTDSSSGVKESSDWLGTFPRSYNGQQIIRLAWGIFPREFISDERFQEMADAGITHCADWRGYNLNVSENLLDCAYRAGVKVILNCSQTATDPEGVVVRFKNHPALDGYYLDDEPDSDKFPALGVLAERLRAVDPDKYSYVNLSPITHNDSQFGVGTENYIKWLDDFIEKLKPRFLSYDNYTIYYTKGIDNLIVNPRMFENLQVIRDAALNANLDFWAFCLTTSHYYGNRTFPIPTIGHLRFYVYSNLAYGAQGIQYFTYWQPRPADSPNSMGHYFLHAPISFEGVRNNSLYNRLKMINAEIKNLSFVFANAKVKWIRHTGPSIPIRTIKLNTELESTPIKTIQASGGLVISLLEKEGNNYLIVVNRDPEEPINLNIETLPTVKRVLKSGAIVDLEKKLRITAGDAAIYTWQTN